MNEFDIIAKYFAPLATDPGAFGLKDDAAILPARPGQDLVVTTDSIAQDTDFFAHDPPGSVAQKALRVNLSDLSAKGAVPHGYLLNLALPHGVTDAWLDDFAAGLARDQRQFGVSLLGGDTSSSENPLAITITAFGLVPAGRMLRRSGAKPGDQVFVTGMMGDSAGGLAIFKREKHALNESARDYLIDRYRVPQPPVAFGAGLRDLANAATDVSDGLLADLGHIAAASGVAMKIEAESLPRSGALRAFWGDGAEAILRAATAGDDYQIAFTAAPEQEARIMAAAKAAHVTVARIGKVAAGQGVILYHGGKPVPAGQPGFRHF